MKFTESLENIEEYWRPNKRVKLEGIFHVSLKDNTNVDKLCLKIRSTIDQLYCAPTQDDKTDDNLNASECKQ